MASVPLPPGIEYLGCLGLGGTAEVARVFVASRRLEAAFKHPLDQDPDTTATFTRLARREQELIGRLRFPGLVPVLEYGQGPQPYLLLELCQGPTLDRIGRIDDVTTAMNIISALALNLQFMRQHQLIHGDLKPHNVFLPESWSMQPDDGLFYLKLSDFSLGRRDDEPAEARAGLGTVGYMAPEVIVEATCDHRSDLFALGVIAYSLLAGRHPFIDGDDADPVRINSRVREAEPTPLGDYRDDLNPGLIDVISALLEKEPQNRTASGWEVCLQLREAGAAYPFEKALQPKHLLSHDRSYQDNVDAVLRLKAREKRRLEVLTSGDVKRLQAILSVNFRRGSLRFDRDRFVFDREVYWPSRLRRELLKSFAEASFGCRRWIVQAAVAGGPSHIDGFDATDRDSILEMSEALTALIRPLLKACTVKRRSMRMAPSAEQRERYDLAARLYMQAGDLTACERSTYQAAVVMNKTHHNHAALRLLNAVISYAEMIGRTFEVRQLLMIRGDILKETGAVEAATTTYLALIELYRDHEADKLLAETYKDLGDLYKMKQEHTAGLEALETALRIYGVLGDELEISHTLNNLGNMHWVGSDYPAALISYRKALRIQRRLKVMDDVASTLSNIGSICFVRGNLDRAVRLYLLSIDICRQEANQLEEARILNNLGYVQSLRGEVAKAVECLEKSLSINRRLGTRKEVLHNLENLTSVMATAGHLKRSIQYLKEGMALAVELDDHPHLAAFKAGMGMTLKRMGRYSEAEKYYREAGAVYDEVDDGLGRAMLNSGLADLRYRLGDTEGALELAEESLRQRAAVKDKTHELQALLVITRMTDDPVHLRRARELARELKLKREATLIEFNALSQRLQHGVDRETAAQFADSLAELDRMPDEIEMPSLCVLAGKLMICVGRHDVAGEYLQRAQRLAGSSGLLPEEIECFTQLGRLHLAVGDFEQAYTCFRTALDTAKEVTGNIHDADDRRSFQSRPTIMYLVSEIKKLAGALTKK